MNSFSNSCLINAGLSALLGFFTVTKNTTRRESLFWSLYCFSVALWSSGLGLMVASTTRSQALFWLRWDHYLGAVMIPIFFFHFTCAFLNEERRGLLYIGYVLAIVQQVLSMCGVLADVNPLVPFNFYTVPKPAYLLFVVYFFFYVFYSHALLFIRMRSSSGQMKTQIKYIFYGTSIAFCGGSTAFLPVFHLPVFPYGVYGVFVYILTVTYAILHKQFMDIQLVLRDTTLHSVTAILLASGSMLVGFPLVSSSHPMFGIIVSTTLMGFLMAFAYDPIRKALQPVVDAVIFSNRFGYLEELSKLPNDMLEFTNLREMLKFVVTRLTDAAKLEFVQIMMYDPAHQSFVQTMVHFANANHNNKIETASLELSEHGPLIAFLKEKSKLWLDKDIHALEMIGKDAILAEFLQMRAVACFPVNKSNELLGVVFLGRKQSGESFNQRDLKILQALRVRLENFLGQAMTITQEALNMVKDSHDMKNDVNALKGRVTWRAMKIASWKMEFEKQIALLDTWLAADAAKGVSSAEQSHVTETVLSLKTQTLEWFAEAVQSRSIEENAIQRLAHRLKNWAEYGRVVSEGFKGSRLKEGVDVGAAAKLSVERWRPMAERKNLKIAAQVSGAPIVWGERSLVEQIIENLIDNAIKATAQGSVDVFVNAVGHDVHVEVRDSGCGIPEEHIATIFAKPFYQGRGRESMEQSTGVGLYLVAQYAKSLGGKVRAESRFGRGSVFAVDLPASRADTGKQEGVAA